MKTGDADDVFVCHDHLVRYWQHQLAKCLIDIGSGQSVISTDLTSELSLVAHWRLLAGRKKLRTQFAARNAWISSPGLHR